MGSPDVSDACRHLHRFVQGTLRGHGFESVGIPRRRSRWLPGHRGLRGPFHAVASSCIQLRGLSIHSGMRMSATAVSLSTEDAEWYFNTVNVGDPVIVQENSIEVPRAVSG
jgi:Uncharacterized protein conserved in bacteria